MPRRAVALEDLFRFKIVGDTQISPDGGQVVYAVKRIDREKNKYFSSLFLGDVESRLSRQLTVDGHNDSEPRWSPDGKQIAFSSDREKPNSQIYLIPVDGGEARAITDLEEGSIQGLSWSPDGTQIAFLYRKTPDEYRKDIKKERQEKEFSSPVRVHKKLFYRLDGFGYFDQSFWQVHVVDIASGKTTAITSDDHNYGAPSWSPDGKSLAFTANRRDDDDLMGQYDDLWTVSAEGGEIYRVEAPAGPKSNATWSPDGKSIAYIGHTDPDDTWGGLNDRILVVPVDGSGAAADLTGKSDKAVGYLTMSDMHDTGCGRQIIWSKDSRSLFCAVSELGSTQLYRVALDGQMAPISPPDHEMGCFSVSDDETRLGVLMGNATDLFEATVWQSSGGAFEPIVNYLLNQDVFAEVQLQAPEEIDVKNHEGGSVHAWMMKPEGFDATKKYPCVLYVHGGPALQYGGKSGPFHELNWLAANGYLVLFSNPRGSKGYGEAHTQAIKGDWGNKDWIDVQAVADFGAALAFMDEKRMAIMGGSYGGFMTAWAVGHTDRFACAIADRLVGNLHSMAGTCDFPWEHGKFYKGNAWDDPSDLWRVSPLHYAGSINTPLLIIHSDGDLRCPIGQAEELFTALRLQRKTVEFIRYPAESSHGLSRNGPPDLRIDRLKKNLEWLDRYLKE